MALDQYCRAMGRHGCVCTDLHALSWHDPARDELVASHFNRFSREPYYFGAHASHWSRRD